jgi:membrane protein required for colicin V production
LAENSIFDNISSLDGIILLFLILGAYKGYKKGLIVEIISLLIFIFLLILVFKGLQVGHDWAEFSKSISFTSFLLFFILIALAVSWLDKLLKTVVKKVLFEGFDNILGAIFGMFKYAVAMAILLQLFTYMGITNANKLSNSKFYPLLTRSAEFTSQFLSYIPQYQEMIEAIQKQLQKKF